MLMDRNHFGSLLEAQNTALAERVRTTPKIETKEKRVVLESACLQRFRRKTLSHQSQLEEISTEATPTDHPTRD